VSQPEPTAVQGFVGDLMRSIRSLAGHEDVDTESSRASDREEAVG
jgi:hypothetical protein